MATFTYPETDFDRRAALMGRLPSFWRHVFSQNALVEDIVFGKAQLENQTLQQLQELFDAVSRFKAPVRHLERWFRVDLVESQRNTGLAAALKYDGEVTYETTTTFKYGVPPPRDKFIWDLPPQLDDVLVLTNRLTDPSMTLIKGVDFVIEDGGLVFNFDPLTDERVAIRETFVGSEVVDREGILWAFRAKLDLEYLFEQFGYILNLRYGDSGPYKQAINAAFDALVEGTTARSVQDLLQAIAGTSLVQEDEEIVEQLLTEQGRKLVVTSDHVYEFGAPAEFLVAAGDRVVRGQPLTDALQIFEFNRGIVPSASDVAGIVMGRGQLLPGFFGDLVFENKDVDLIVESDEEGFTRLSWQISGFPGDVEMFFDVLHERGLAAGQTLAHLLDQRTNKVGEPKASNLPATINPMGFLVENVLRNNYYLIKLNTSAFGGEALGISAGKILRRLHPPQTGVIVCAQLAQRDRPIIMEGPGTATDPGYEERVTSFEGNRIDETLGTDMVVERVRLTRIAGRCQ
jgi:hypothetical protein